MHMHPDELGLFRASAAQVAAHHGWTTADKAAVASAMAAAIAAAASWVAVLQSSRLQRRSLEPRLHIQVSEQLVPGGQNRILVRVENTGGGFAHEVLFWVREGAHIAMGGLPPHGSLGPGKGSTVRTALQPVRGRTSAEALVIWKYGTKVYAQAGAPAHRKSWSRRKWAFWAPKNSEKIVRRFFKDVGSAEDWRLVPYELES
jgi:hypothetical protein